MTVEKENNKRQTDDDQRSKRSRSSSSETSTTTSSSVTSSNDSQSDTGSSTSESTSSSSSETSSTSSRSSHKRSAKRRRRSASEETGPKRVHVGRLTRNVTKDHLKEIFSTYGVVKEVQIPIDRVHPHLNKGYAYITYQTAKQAEMAFKFMNEGMIDGQAVTVGLILEQQLPSNARGNTNRTADNSRSKWSSGRDYKQKRNSSPNRNNDDARKRRYSRSSSRSY